MKKLIVEQQHSSKHQQHHNRKPTTYDNLSESFSRAMRSRSPDLDADLSQFRKKPDRLSAGGSRAMSLPSTPTMPSIDVRQQELVARLDFLSNLKYSILYFYSYIFLCFFKVFFVQLPFLSIFNKSKL